MTEYPQLENALVSEGFEILSSHSENNNAFFKLKIPRVERPPHPFLEKLKEEIKNIDYINELINYNFKMGKKAENCSFLEFNFSLVNGVSTVNTEKHRGKLIEFVSKNNIKSLSEFVHVTCPAMEDINKFVKVYKPADKKELYSIKRQYIKFLYSTGFIENIFKQFSEKDELVLINTKVNGISFHVRYHDYLDKMTGVMPYELPLNYEVYKPKEYTEADIKSPEFSMECASLLNGIYGERRFISNIFGERLKDLHYS